MAVEAGIELSEKEIQRFEKAYEKAVAKGKSKADAVLRAEANAMRNYLRSQYPKLTGNLRKGVQVNAVKKYPNGARVARVRSTAHHSHLLEYGHNVTRKKVAQY